MSAELIENQGVTHSPPGGETIDAGSVGAVAHAIDRAVADQEAQESTRLATLPLDKDRLGALQNELRTAWKQHRAVVALLRDVDAYAEVNEQPPSDERFFGLDQLIPRVWLVADSPTFWIPAVRELGTHLARRETVEFANVLTTIRTKAVTGELPDIVTAEATALMTRPNARVVIFFARSWRLWQALGLQAFPADPALFSETVGLAAYDVPTLPRSKIFVVDVSRFLEWRQWTANELGDLRIRVRSLEAHEIEKDLVDKVGGQRETRRRELEASLLLSVRERFEINVRDSNAAVALEHPSLRPVPRA